MDLNFNYSSDEGHLDTAVSKTWAGGCTYSNQNKMKGHLVMKSTIMAAVKKIIIKGLEDKTENINIL